MLNFYVYHAPVLTVYSSLAYVSMNSTGLWDVTVVQLVMHFDKPV